MSIRFTQLAETLAGEQRRCHVCQWHCGLQPAETGQCLVRANTADGIAVLNDGLISAATFGFIEDVRLWHLLPGTPVLLLGSWGYAFPADQGRGPYGHIPSDEAKHRRLAPERVATVALEKLCRGVVWAYGDPSVSHEYLLDVMQISRANSRYTAMVSTGYLTREALDQLGHYLDGICLDLRGFDDAAYSRLAGVEGWRGILEVIAHAQRRWNCHIEVLTRLHPGVNDGSEQLAAMASWIASTLGPLTPWHVLPGDAGAAASAAVARARRAGHEAGMHFLFGPDAQQPTLCPFCGTLVIERTANGSRAVRLDQGGCGNCGADLGIRMSIFKRGA